MENVAASASTTGTTVQPDLNSTSGPSGPQTGGQQTSTAAPTQPAVSNTNDWTSTLNDQQKLFVQNKGFKDSSAILDSYQNLEKLMGAPRERLLKLPEKADAPEWNEIYDKLGRPKEAKEYTFTAPQGAKTNPEFTDWAQKQFHALGLTKSQGEQLASKWNEYAQGDQTKIQAEQAATLKTDQTALKREWGAAYEQNIKAAALTANKFGLGEAEVQKLESALGYSATLKFLQSIGSKLGEDGFIQGGNNAFQGAMTPDMAQAKLTELRADTDFTRRYLAGGSAEKSMMDKLMRFAYPDMPQD